MEMDICFEGIGQITATFRTDGKVLPGMAVALTKEIGRASCRERV